MLLGAGALLLAFTLQAEWLIAPLPLGVISRAAARAAFFVTFPVRLFSGLVFHPQDHHWPLAHFVTSSFLAPFFWYAAWRIGSHCFRKVATQPAHGGLGRMPRRRFLATSAVGAAGIFSGGTGAYGVFVEPQRVKVRVDHVTVRDLPKAFDGLRLAHITDSHYGPFISLQYLERIVRQTNELRPDLVLLTGDYVLHTQKAIAPGIGVFGKLESTYGSVAVLGNHDHWEGLEECRAAFERIGVPLIDNRRLFLTSNGLSEVPVEHESLCVAGVGDLWEDEVSFDRALEHVPDAMPRVVLSHNPDAAELLQPNQRVDLMCSGHTHGGQVRVPGLGTPIVPSRYGQKYTAGLCTGPRCPVLVSAGVGMAALPVRLGVPPEIGLIVLQRETQSDAIVA